MKKLKALGLFFAICNLAFSEETVLVPTDNGGYIRVPISEIIPQEKKEKIKEIKKEEEIKAKEKIIEKAPVRRKVIPISENTLLDDLLTVSMNYDYKKIEKESLDNNKKNSYKRFYGESPSIKNRRIYSKKRWILYAWRSWKILW